MQQKMASKKEEAMDKLKGEALLRAKNNKVQVSVRIKSEKKR